MFGTPSVGSGRQRDRNDEQGGVQVTLRLKLVALIGAILVTAVVSTAATAGKGGSSFQAKLTGYEELPTLSTSAKGSFRAALNEAGDTISYRLRYSGPFDAGATATVTQAHIHFGARAFSGGVSAFLCTNLGNGPAGTPACPATGGTVTGTITAAQIVGPANQGIAATEFAELVRALRAGAAYANVHSTSFQPGEIRGQISRGRGHDEDDDD
jgi:hypothetical protein